MPRASQLRAAFEGRRQAYRTSGTMLRMGTAGMPRSLHQEVT
jgi:hypothetical protein